MLLEEFIEYKQDFARLSQKNFYIWVRLGARMGNRIMRIRFAAICALLLCAMVITARTATITLTNTNHSDAGSSTFIADYPGSVSARGVARGVYPTRY